MKSRLAFPLVAIACVAFGGVCFASLYGWNDTKRPPVSLRDAVARAEAALGADAANRYCVSVTLYGDRTGEGKSGAWNLLYAAADGSKQHVYVNMQGQTTVRPWNGPIDLTRSAGRPADLEDVRRRVAALFAGQKIEAPMTIGNGRLTAAYRVRTYQVYPDDGNGNYGRRLEDAPGPASDGIWLEAQVVDQPDWRELGYADGPYWQWHRATYLLGDGGKFLAVDLRYGKQTKREVIDGLTLAFGERVPQH